MSGSYTEKKIISAISAITLNIEALNAATEKMLDKESYNISYDSNFMRLYFHLCYMSDKKFCAESIWNFYKKCKHADLFNATLTERYPALYPFLRDEDSDGLANFLIRHNTPTKMLAANMLARLRAGGSRTAPQAAVSPQTGTDEGWKQCRQRFLR
jgi:hypothetical protein